MEDGRWKMEHEVVDLVGLHEFEQDDLFHKFLSNLD